MADLWYPVIATLCCLAVAGVFGLLELLVDELQRQAAQRRACRLAADLLEATPA